jgi:hypothetical protein
MGDHDGLESVITIGWNAQFDAHDRAFALFKGPAGAASTTT